MVARRYTLAIYQERTTPNIRTKNDCVISKNGTLNGKTTLHSPQRGYPTISYGKKRDYTRVIIDYASILQSLMETLNLFYIMIYFILH